MTVHVSGQIGNIGNVQQKLFHLRGADMTLSSDQAFTKLFGGTNFMVTSIVAVLKSGVFGTACTGGIYNAASKGGSALVASTQSYAGLSGASKAVVATLAAVASTDVQSAIPILSLTTGNTGALTADLFIYGIVVD